MAKYYLERFFVPEDKNIYDMLDTCGTPVDKLWHFAKGYGIITAPNSEDIQNIHSYISRLTFDRQKLLHLFEINSTQDREEKFKDTVIPDAVEMDKVKAAVSAIQDERSPKNDEQYTVRQVNNSSLEVSVKYIDPDHSRAEALQVREREVKILVEQVDNRLVVRHHSTDKGDDIAKELIDRLLPDEEARKRVKALNFSGIRDAKTRTKFFRDLAYGMKDFVLRDVPSLKVFRFTEKPEKSDNTEEEEEEQVSANIKKVFLSGTDIMHCPEYIELEKRGFFISSMTWVSELSDDNKEHFEFTAGFNDPDAPTNIAYAATGKFARDGDGSIKKHKAQLSKFERQALMRTLSEKAYELYDALTASKPATDGS